MKAKASELADFVDGTLHGNDVDINGGVVTDSRSVKPGDIYVARVGKQLDGHRFISAAAESGAVLSVVQYPVQAGIAQLQVSNSSDALGKIAQFWIQKLRSGVSKKIDVVGITGSVGKTTTKDLLGRILRSIQPTVVNKASYNNEVGMPLTALRATEDTRFLVCEMGADKRGDLTSLTSLVPPDIAVVLAVGTAHLGKFGSVEALAAAKSELISGLRPRGIAVLNYDNPRVRDMRALAPGKVLLFSAQGDPNADFSAQDISLDTQGRAKFSLHCAEGEFIVQLGLVGAHHISNALAAVTTASALGVSVQQSVESISLATADSPHRMNVFTKDEVRFIDDSYNANPDSMVAALQALVQLGPIRPAGRKVAVLGTMLELGKESDYLHATIGEKTVELGVDLVITVGDGTLPLYAAVRDRVEAFHFHSWTDVRDKLGVLVKSGDTVLLKGSWGSKIWELADDVLEGMIAR